MRSCAPRAVPRFVAAVSLFAASGGASARAASCEGVHPTDATTLKSVVVATGVERPLFVTAPAGDQRRIFVVGQKGVIWIRRRGTPVTDKSVFLDISQKTAGPPSCNECGLLGVAFAPDYATSGAFYVSYTESTGTGLVSTVSRFTVSADPDVADPASELRLLRIAQPANETNHKGGWLGFGNDGYLYAAFGDGGGAGDQHGACGNGQSTATLLGKILRIDPTSSPSNRPADCGGTTNYRVPADNPLVGGPASQCEEIFAWGLRNPFRASFDEATGDLYIGDVGQACYEEIDYQTPAQGLLGRNYGWREMEGRHCYNHAFPNCGANPPATGCPAQCDDPALALPILEYGHGSNCSVTGGFVYRGCEIPALEGAYFYGDYCSGFVKSFRVVEGAASDLRDWTSQVDPGNALDVSLTSFGTDAEGAIYITDKDGIVTRLSPPFSDLEVAGKGTRTSDQFLLGRSAWTWQDLAYASWQTVALYRVHRATAVNGAYSCVHSGPQPSWAGGDPASPAPGTGFYYLVIAVAPDNSYTESSVPPHVLVPGPCS